MANMERPDSALVKELAAKANAQLAGFKAIIDSESIEREAVRIKAQALFDDRLKTALEAIEVEHLARGKQGIRVALLREKGYTNMWQISKLGFSQICAIEGLGEQSARKILDIAKETLENTKENLRVRINADSPVKADEELVKALYVMIKNQPLRSECASVYGENHQAVNSELSAVKKAKSGLSWLFASKAKKQSACNAAVSLQNRLSGDFGRIDIMNSFKENNNADYAFCFADFAANSVAYYTALEQVGKSWGKENVSDTGLSSELLAEIEAQNLNLEGLKATLRSYQTFGVKYIVHQKRSLLGDEMGLGKTMQAIASMCALKNEGKHHFMVVCPASVLINWCREIVKFSDFEVTKVHGSDEQALLHWRKNGGVAVTTYESISRFELPEKFKFAMLVADEAHYVKNPEAKRTKALASLLSKTESVLFMSGTPLENKVEEMCFLVSLLNKEISAEIEKVKYISTAEQFRTELAPVYLRRTREDVLTELPELVEKEQWCEMNKTELSAYRDAVLSENFMAMRQVSWNVSHINDSTKAQRLLELCDKAKEEGRKVIVFSFFRETLRKASELLGDRCMEVITGEVSPQRRQEIVDEFGKADAGAVLISQVQAGGTGLNIQSASVIIFCEPQIKPSIENQAISRAYRMGQVRDVLVYRLLSDETIDERMLNILSTKQEAFDNFADKSVIGEEALEIEESVETAEDSWISQMVKAEKERLSNC
ncbi:MAG: DEAD/DEAH box helicase [Ruminococcus sp.]|nr:DEAD/DEAH box helicase [Ruminococcus sp.]